MDNGQLQITGTPEPESFAFELRQYGHSPSGHAVTERVPLAGQLPDSFPRFVTNVIHRIQVQNQDPVTGQVTTVQHEKLAPNVPIPGADIHEAMAALPDIVKTISEQLHREMMAKLTGKTLVLPGDPGFRR